MRTAAQTAFIMAILTLLSKCFGFAREMVMANYYGTSYITDAYVMATAIPGIIFGGVLAAVSTSYMPTFSHTIENSGIEEGNRFTSQIINILIILSIFSAILGFVYSDFIVGIFASGFNGETAALTSFYIKITFTYIFFSSVAGIFDSFLQYKGSFLPPIITGYFLSGCTLIAIIISAYTNHYFLAFGMLIGHILRFLVIAIISKKKSFEYSFSLRLNERVKGIFILALPVFIGSSLMQINTFVDKTLASSLKEGSVSALNYASLLNVMVMAMTITIMTTIIYPKLSKAYSLKDNDQFNLMLEKGINIVLIVALPCSLGAMYYSNQVVQIVYERGAFDQIATTMTSSAFLFYISGLIFYSLNELLTKIYYSMHDMKTPMLCASVNVILNVTLNIILVKSMAHNGLALATSIAGLGNFILLFYSIKTKHPEIKILKSKKKLLKIIAASLLAVTGSALFYNIIILSLTHIIYIRFVQLLLAVLVAAVLYYVLLKLLKIDEVDIIKQLVSKH